MRMTPGEMHVRAAEANLANAMLRLVSLTPATDRSAEDISAAMGAALASTEEAQRAVDDTNLSAPYRRPASHASFHVGAPLRLDAAQSQLARLQ